MLMALPGQPMRGESLFDENVLPLSRWQTLANPDLETFRPPAYLDDSGFQATRRDGVCGFPCGGEN
jgi:hypothetical protein